MFFFVVVVGVFLLFLVLDGKFAALIVSYFMPHGSLWEALKKYKKQK